MAHARINMLQRTPTPRKNRKKAEWIDIQLTLEERRRQGKKSEVYEWGEKMEESRRALSRLRISIPDLEQGMVEQVLST